MGIMCKHHVNLYIKVSHLLPTSKIPGSYSRQLTVENLKILPKRSYDPADNRLKGNPSLCKVQSGAILKGTIFGMLLLLLMEFLFYNVPTIEAKGREPNQLQYFRGEPRPQERRQPNRNQPLSL